MNWDKPLESWDNSEGQTESCHCENSICYGQNCAPTPNLCGSIKPHVTVLEIFEEAIKVKWDQKDEGLIGLNWRPYEKRHQRALSLFCEDTMRRPGSTSQEGSSHQSFTVLAPWARIPRLQSCEKHFYYLSHPICGILLAAWANTPLFLQQTMISKWKGNCQNGNIVERVARRPVSTLGGH